MRFRQRARVSGRSGDGFRRTSRAGVPLYPLSRQGRQRGLGCGGGRRLRREVPGARLHTRYRPLPPRLLARLGQGNRCAVHRGGRRTALRSSRIGNGDFRLLTSPWPPAAPGRLLYRFIWSRASPLLEELLSHCFGHSRPRRPWRTSALLCSLQRSLLKGFRVWTDGRRQRCDFLACGPGTASLWGHPGAGGVRRW